MKNAKKIFQILLSLLCITSAKAAETITIAPGRQHVISSPGVKRAAIGDPDVADVKALPDAQQVIVTGAKRGTTDLILWFRDGSKKSYLIEVNTKGRNIEQEVRAMLDGMEGVSLRRTGGNLTLEGQVFRGEDLEKIAKITKNYSNVKDNTRVNPQALEYMGHQIAERLEKAGLEQVTVRSEVDTIFLEGEVSRKGDIARAENLAKSIYSKVSNSISVGVSAEPLILVDVKMMEIRKNSLGDVGLDWPNSISSDASASFGGGAGWSGIINIGGEKPTLNLKAMVAKGLAKVLSNPKLLCRNGTPASFLAGGEIPIRVVGERTADVIFKEYGVKLEIKAKIDQSRRVYLEIESKISDLDSSTAIDNIPGILEHRVKTAANLRLGDTIVLGGLIEDRSRKNVEKVPFLGHVPILGELFKSRSFQKNESEFVIFLTPFSGDATSTVARQTLKKADEHSKRFDKELKLSILD